MQLYLQELCSHETLAATLHAKYAGPPPAPGATPLPPAPAASLALRLRPVPAARCQAGAGGLLERLAIGGGGGRGAAPEGAPPGWIEVYWEVRARGSGVWGGRGAASQVACERCLQGLLLHSPIRAPITPHFITAG